MRALTIYVVFALGRAVAVCHGANEARRISPTRSYKAFATQEAAEEYAAWWNYTNDNSPKAGNASFPPRRPS